ncbi:hypothetical protein GCM10022402_16980 [Salinactinospora qingdaonensis]|uniref:Uncharacterized protein n=1 Tax=Salinactinospora qingdaonensis TaxID=702744 RepID=A0ABP7FHP8_9ACTN
MGPALAPTASGSVTKAAPWRDAALAQVIRGSPAVPAASRRHRAGGKAAFGTLAGSALTRARPP